MSLRDPRTSHNASSPFVGTARSVEDTDTVLDVGDAYPLISITGRTDTDADGAPDSCDSDCVATGMAADTDDDNDTVLDVDDAFPTHSVSCRKHTAAETPLHRVCRFLLEKKN